MDQGAGGGGAVSRLRDFLYPKGIECKNCGAELKGAKFCPECGTKAV